MQANIPPPSLLDTVTVGDLFKMIRSANAERPDKAIQGMAIVINALGLMTSGHTVPNKPPFHKILADLIDTLPADDQVKLSLEIMLMIRGLKDSRTAPTS